MPKPKAVATLTKADIPQIIQRYINGESIQAIATDAHVARNTIYQWMHGIGEQKYPELVTQAMIARMALADHQLDTAESHEDIARAREACKFTRWDLERRRPRTWGVRAEITMNGPAAIYLGLAEPAIETTCTQLPQADEQADESNRVNP
jgi:hypothetical protein